MKAKRHTIRKFIAKSLVSVLLLAILVVPILLTVRWGIGLADMRDHRKVTKVESLHVRQIDKSATPVVPFSQPLISITFDDGWESVYTEALPVLQDDGFATTQYIISGEFSNQAYMSVAQVKSMQQAGHEIGAHTIDHEDLTTLDEKQLTHQLLGCRNDLEKLFGPIYDFTSPYGSYNAYTLESIGKYYRSQKNAEGDPAANELEAINVAGKFDTMNFVSYSVRNTTTINDLKKLVYAARKHNGWLVLTYHQVDSSGEEYSVNPDDFKQQMDYLSGENIRSATVRQVMDALAVNQKAGD